MILHIMVANMAAFGAPPVVGLAQWMGPQAWTRDLDEPVLALGDAGAWDDTHIFAPCVAFDDGEYRMWYPGSSGAVAERIFRLGLATSADGVHFARHPDSPIFAFGDGKRSVLTPTLLRHPDGTVCREDGALRLWFSAADLSASDGLHALHETRSADGLHWAAPSPAQLEYVYAPTIIKEGDVYHLWYTDVRREPWTIRHAQSTDGRAWHVDDYPCIEIDQGWEEGRLFYPSVVKDGDAYLMWYGAYWAGHPHKTALGLAVSADGRAWHKNPYNPVFRPDPSHSWESHYTTSQSIMRAEDGTWRIWYASRTAPPHVNKYFAIGAAHWAGPTALTGQPWPERAVALRARMAEILTFPKDKVPPRAANAPRTRGRRFPYRVRELRRRSRLPRHGAALSARAD